MMDNETIAKLGFEAGADSVGFFTLKKFAELVAAHEREAIFDEWHSCVMSDLEHGVKCLNERAAEEWHKNYPAQSKMFPEWIKARGNT